PVEGVVPAKPVRALPPATQLVASVTSLPVTKVAGVPYLKLALVASLSGTTALLNSASFQVSVNGRFTVSLILSLMNERPTLVSVQAIREPTLCRVLHS